MPCSERHAGVSTTAVSKVLRNATGTSPQMRTRVRAAIDQLGYRPSTAARALRGRTYTIGVLLPDVRNPFFADVLDGVAGHLAGTEYQLLMASCCDDEASEALVVDALIDRSMDGVVLVAPVSSPGLLERVARTLPTAVIGRHTSPAGFDTVTGDDFAGAALVVSHLAGLLLERIADPAHRASAVKFSPHLVVRRTTAPPPGDQ